jgi:hypothetical protein
MSQPAAYYIIISNHLRNPLLDVTSRTPHKQHCFCALGPKSFNCRHTLSTSWVTSLCPKMFFSLAGSFLTSLWAFGPWAKHYATWRCVTIGVMGLLCFVSDDSRAHCSHCWAWSPLPFCEWCVLIQLSFLPESSHLNFTLAPFLAITGPSVAITVFSSHEQPKPYAT